MNAPSIKIELINWLTQLKDKQLLESLLSVKKSVITEDWYDHISASQRKSIDTGIEDHKKGRVLSSKQFWSRYEKKA